MKLGKIGSTDMMHHGMTAGDYVQNGLVAMWDGIENAGCGVHDAAATTCVDLSGNGYDVTLANCTIEDDAWYVNAARAAYVANKTFPSRPTTFEVVCSRVRGNDYFFTSTGLGFVLAGGNFQMVNTKTANNAVVAPSGWSSGRKIQFSAEYGGVGLTRFTLGGVGDLSIITYDNYWDAHSYNIEFGSNVNYYGAIRLHSLRLYSRALTTDEVAANYAVDRARFNLP